MDIEQASRSASHQPLYELRKRIYLWEMNRWKRTAKKKTVERQYKELVEECRKIVENYDNHIKPHIEGP